MTGMRQRLPSAAVTTQQRRWILSGGLASGKSHVRRLLDEAGMLTIDADRVGHEVLEPDGPAFAAVAERWPQVVSEGRIDRAALAAIVFADRDELGELESITHPYIFDTIHARMEGYQGVAIVEMPLLGDGLGEGWSRIVVDSRDDVRLNRAIARGMSEEDVRARMAAQPSRGEWLAQADLVVPNHRSVEDLAETVGRLAVALRR